MRKIVSILVICSLITVIFPTSILAQDNNVKEETFTTKDGYTGKTSETSQYVKTEVYNTEGNFVDSTIVDKNTGKVTYTQKDGTIKYSDINDYVKKVTIKAPSNIKPKLVKLQGQEKNSVSANEIQALSSSIDDEPVEDKDLISGGYDDGYKLVGHASVYYFDQPGYLFRITDSMIKHDEHQFQFSAGTAVSLIVSIVVATFSGPAGWCVAVIEALLITAGGVLIDYFIGTFDTRTYNYLYKVRVCAEPTYEPFRNITYYVSYDDTTETLTFVQKSFNDGYSPSNSEMVRVGIDNYITSYQ